MADLTSPEYELVKLFREMKIGDVLSIESNPNKDKIFDFIKYCIDVDAFQNEGFRMEISSDFTKFRKLQIITI